MTPNLVINALFLILSLDCFSFDKRDSRNNGSDVSATATHELLKNYRNISHEK